MLREATRMVGVVPNAAYRHFADRDELLAAVCHGRHARTRRAHGRRRRPRARQARRPRRGPPPAGRDRRGAYLEFAREEPGLFVTAFALPQQHAYSAADGGTGQDRTPLGQLRTALDELVDAGVLDRRRRDGVEYPVWSAVHGTAVLAGQGPLRDVPDATRRHLEELTRSFIDGSLAQDRPPL